MLFRIILAVAGEIVGALGTKTTLSRLAARRPRGHRGAG